MRGDAAAAAKALRDYARETDLLPFKGGFMDGNAADAEDIGAIARLPTPRRALRQLVGVVAYPISGLARTLNALIGGLAIALGQIQEQGLVGQDAPAEAPAPRSPRPRSPRPRAEAEPAEEPAAEETR